MRPNAILFDSRVWDRIVELRPPLRVLTHPSWRVLKHPSLRVLTNPVPSPGAGILQQLIGGLSGKE